MRRPIFATCLAALVIGSPIGPAVAAPLVYTCVEKEISGEPSIMTLTYEGEAEGTLRVAGSFGEMLLPATKEEVEIDLDGQKLQQTGIRAFGAAKVQMPDKVALEACIAGKRQPDETDDILGLMSCRESVATTETEIKASVEIATGGAFEPGTAWVYLKRTYLEQSAGYLDGNGEAGGPISIESVPPPDCEPAQAQ